tara:strand:+ start:4974 stop:6170 length:1197 start_codon:yes stop_codon:yes gene_type:complete
MQIVLKDSKNDKKILSDPLTCLDPTQRSWIEVSGKAIENNVREIKSFLSKDCKFMAVVKADGYGHDAKFISDNAIKGGADQLGVATLQEGLLLRSQGIGVPILVLGNLYCKGDLISCFKNDLMPTISDIRACIACNDIGKEFHKQFLVHLKVDTGMSRLGFEPKRFIDSFKKILSFENIKLDGIYSHLASADDMNAHDDNSFANTQRKKFLKVLSDVKIEEQPSIKIHLANSAATLLGSQYHFDMVRVGLSMYGYNPLKINTILNLKPALFLKSKVSFIREINANIGVSYGQKFISDRKTKLAVISIGYADGICRKLSNKISLIHKGSLYPQVGAITMDQLIIDVTDSHEVKIGDTVTLLGFENDIVLSPLDWADKASTIPWEILCAFKNRLPRVKRE